MLTKLKNFLLLIFIFVCDSNSFSMQEKVPQINQNHLHNPGLENAGNSCYFNSIIQCLSAIPELTDPLIKNGKNVYLENSIPWHYISLLEDIKEKKLSENLSSNYCIPLQINNGLMDTPLKELYKASAKKYFNCPGNQEDANEFLVKFYGSIFSFVDMKKNNKDLNIEDIEENFVFKIGRILEHSKCKIQHPSAVDPFKSLELNVVSPFTQEFSCLKNILDDFFMPGYISDYKWIKKCANGENIGATTQSKFSSLPKIFIISLKRFEEKEVPILDLSNFFQSCFYNIEKERHKFLGHHVDIPMTLKIDQSWTNNLGDNHSYELFGVVVYIEWLTGGHYVTYVKNNTGDKWTLFNDCKTEKKDPGNKSFFEFPPSLQNSDMRNYAVNFYLNSCKRNLFIQTICNKLENIKKLSSEDIWAVVQKENLLKEIENLKKDISKAEELENRQQNMKNLENRQQNMKNLETFIKKFKDEGVELSTIFRQSYSYEAVDAALKKMFKKQQYTDDQEQQYTDDQEQQYTDDQNKIKKYYENEFKYGTETQTAPYILFYRHKNPELLKNQNSKQDVQETIVDSDRPKESKNLFKNLLQKLRDTLQKLKEKLGSSLKKNL
jgi:ubiquitin C-terminal hydrolase